MSTMPQVQTIRDVFGKYVVTLTDAYFQRRQVLEQRGIVSFGPATDAAAIGCGEGGLQVYQELLLETYKIWNSQGLHPSHRRIEINATSRAELNKILERLRQADANLDELLERVIQHSQMTCIDKDTAIYHYKMQAECARAREIVQLKQQQQRESARLQQLERQRFVKFAENVKASTVKLYRKILEAEAPALGFGFNKHLSEAGKPRFSKPVQDNWQVMFDVDWPQLKKNRLNFYYAFVDSATGATLNWLPEGFFPIVGDYRSFADLAQMEVNLRAFLVMYELIQPDFEQALERGIDELAGMHTQT
jgi:hypothetical protein